MSSTYSRHFYRVKTCWQYPTWLVISCASMWISKMYLISVGRWCHPDIFLQFVCVGSPPPAVSRAFGYILHQPKSSKYVFTNVCKDWQPAKMMKHLNLHGILFSPLRVFEIGVILLYSYRNSSVVHHGSKSQCSFLFLQYEPDKGQWIYLGPVLYL